MAKKRAVKKRAKKKKAKSVQGVLKTRLVAARDEEGKTIKDIAIAADISPPTLTRWLSESQSSRRRIRADTVDKLAEYFEMELVER